MLGKKEYLLREWYGKNRNRDVAFGCQKDPEVSYLIIQFIQMIFGSDNTQ